MDACNVNNLVDMVEACRNEPKVVKWVSFALREAVEVYLRDVMQNAPNTDEVYILPSELDEARFRGKIPAIKMIRARTGLGLKEAKEAIERVMALKGLDFVPPL